MSKLILSDSSMRIQIRGVQFSVMVLSVVHNYYSGLVMDLWKSAEILTDVQLRGSQRLYACKENILLHSIFSSNAKHLC